MKKIIYVDMDNVLVDFQSGIDQLDDKTLKEYHGNLDEVPGIFSLMKPIDKAIESFIKLTKYYDVYVLSTSPWNNPTALQDKLNWIKKYLGKYAYKKLIFSHHKNLNKGDYLIDDRIKNGVKEFEGEHIHFGTKKFPDWESVTKYLIDEKFDIIKKDIVIKLLGEGGSITGYELIDNKNNSIGFTYSTDEYYDIDEDLFIKHDKELYGDFESLWLVLQEKYDLLYHLFPDFIKDEHKVVVKEMLLDDFFNSKIETYNMQEWFEIIGLDFETAMTIKKHHQK